MLFWKLVFLKCLMEWFRFVLVIYVGCFRGFLSWGINLFVDISGFVSIGVVCGVVGDV